MTSAREWIQFEQSIPQGQAMPIQKGQGAQAPFLRHAAGKDQRLCAVQLSAQGFILALGGLEGLPLQIRKDLAHVSD